MPGHAYRFKRARRGGADTYVECLHQFINDYQQLTKIPAPVPTDIELTSLVEEIRALFQSEFQKRKIEFSAEIVPEDQIIRADANLLQQVIINLVNNGVEALENVENAELKFRSQPEMGRVQISITDNGTGIEPDVLDEIFVPFYTTKPQGSGIGLSLARQIMRMHGGKIRIASKKGKGTTVYLDFQG